MGLMHEKNTSILKNSTVHKELVLLEEAPTWSPSSSTAPHLSFTSERHLVAIMS